MKETWVVPILQSMHFRRWHQQKRTMMMMMMRVCRSSVNYEWVPIPVVISVRMTLVYLHRKLDPSNRSILIWFECRVPSNTTAKIPEPKVNGTKSKLDDRVDRWLMSIIFFLVQIHRRPHCQWKNVVYKNRSIDWIDNWKVMQRKSSSHYGRDSFHLDAL